MGKIDITKYKIIPAHKRVTSKKRVTPKRANSIKNKKRIPKRVKSLRSVTPKKGTPLKSDTVLMSGTVKEVTIPLKMFNLGNNVTTEIYDSNMNIVNFKYFNYTGIYHIKTFLDGNLKTFKSYYNQILHGKQLGYYDNCRLQYELNCANNKLVGMQYKFNINGGLKYEINIKDPNTERFHRRNLIDGLHIPELNI